MEDKKKSLTVGVITNDKYGLRLIEIINERTPFEVQSFDLPKLPEWIEDPDEFLEALDIPDGFFTSDIIFSYALHLDLNPEIIKAADRHESPVVVVPGGRRKQGIIPETKTTYVTTHSVCCAMGRSGNPYMKELLKWIGMPKFEIKVENGKVMYVKVLRASPCGAAYYVAERLIGEKVEDAPARAGLLAQRYPCRANRGMKGDIHRAGEIHLEAVMKAIENED